MRCSAASIQGFGDTRAIRLRLRVAAPGRSASPFDPVTVGAVLATFLAVAVVASLLPALRASRTDPVEVLKAE